MDLPFEHRRGHRYSRYKPAGLGRRDPPGHGAGAGWLVLAIPSIARTRLSVPGTDRLRRGLQGSLRSAPSTHRSVGDSPAFR